MNNPQELLTYTVPVPADKAGNRVDRLLAEALPDLSRARIQALIAEGRVCGSGGRVVESSKTKTAAGDVYVISVPPPRPAEPESQDIPLNVVFEDDDVIVVDKPAGLVVHPAAGNPDRTLVNALLAHCGASLSGIGGVQRPGIVHRIDKDTSGLIVAAKNDRAHHALAAQFEAHSLERAYYALVWGVPAPREGDIEGAIGRHPKDRKRMTIARTGGKAALTHYRVERVVGSRASLVECRLATGRTHQIRVHLTAIGHPLIGDPVYGDRSQRRMRGIPDEIAAAVRGFNRQALHAYLIGFRHPSSGETIRLISNIPNEIKDLMRLLESC